VARAQVRVAKEHMPRMPTSPRAPRAKKKNSTPQLHSHLNHNRNARTQNVFVLAHNTKWAGRAPAGLSGRELEMSRFGSTLPPAKNSPKSVPKNIYYLYKSHNLEDLREIDAHEGPLAQQARHYPRGAALRRRVGSVAWSARRRGVGGI